MEDLEMIPLSVTATTEGERRVIGRGESLNTTQSINVKEEDLETVLRMRWPALDHEYAVVHRLLKKSEKEKLSLREYAALMEEMQTIWSTARPRQLLFQMSGSVQDNSIKRSTSSALHSIKTVCVNEFWAFAVRKRHEESPPLLAIASVVEPDEITWEDTEIIIANFRVGSAYFDQLFIVDDFELKVINVVTRVVDIVVPLVPLLKPHIASENPPHVTAIRSSDYFVVITIQSHGALVFGRMEDFPLLGFIAGPVSIAVPDHKEMFALGMQDGRVEYWHTGKTCLEQLYYPDGNGGRQMSEEHFFTDDVTTASKRNIRMKPQMVFNAFISGPRVAVSSREYFVMADKNPSTCRICKLDDSGTLDYFTAFGDFVVTGEHAGALLMHEYASGFVFYRSDEPKRNCKICAPVGSEHISFAYDRIVDLLPNGYILVVTTKVRELVRKTAPGQMPSNN
jgi:hypothetical protein